MNLVSQVRKTGAGRVAQAVECLLSKHEALSSNTSTTKKNKIKEKEEERQRKKEVGGVREGTTLPNRQRARAG
jgi:hypothetical protein